MSEQSTEDVLEFLDRCVVVEPGRAIIARHLPNIFSEAGVQTTTEEELDYEKWKSPMATVLQVGPSCPVEGGGLRTTAALKGDVVWVGRSRGMAHELPGIGEVEIISFEEIKAVLRGELASTLLKEQNDIQEKLEANKGTSGLFLSQAPTIVVP